MNATSIIKITLDANILLGAVDGDPSRLEEIAALRDLRTRGVVHLAMTSRLIQDVQGDKDRARAAAELTLAKDFEILSAPVRFDMTFLDGPDHYATAEEQQLDRQLRQIIRFPRPGERKNSIRDADHLLAHRAASRDYFLTCDEGILKKGADLLGLGIRVVHPMALRGQSATDPQGLRRFFDQAIGVIPQGHETTGSR